MDVQTLARYTNELVQNERIMQPKQVDVFVRTQDEGFASALNDALAAVRSRSPRATYGMPNFQVGLLSGRVWAGAKIYGDPWGLHAIVSDARALSRRFPLVRFEVECEDGPSFVLRDGASESPELAYLDSWVKGFPPPRLEQPFSCLYLRLKGSCNGVGAVLSAVREQAEDHSTELDVRLDEAGGKVKARAKVVDMTSTRVLLGLIFECSRLWFIDGGEPHERSVGVVAQGDVNNWSIEVEDWSVFAGLQTVLCAALRE